MIPKNPTSLSSATCMQRRRMLATKRSRWKRSSTSTTIPLISSSTMSSSSSPPLLLLGIKPLTWFQDNKGSKADYKVLFVKIAQTPSNKYLKVLARCTITQKEMELLLWNNDKKDIDCGAVVTTFNDPANPYEFVVRNVYAKEADARYKTNWTETQLHFNHDASHLFIQR